MKKYNLFINSILLIMILLSSCKSKPIRLFAGTFTESGEKGFNIIDLNPEGGQFKLVSKSDAGPNPSYFCISHKYGYIYAVNELMNFKGLRGGGVTTLSYDAKTGGIEKISDLNIPDGSPCFISLSPDEDFLLLANYEGGSVVIVKLDEKGIPIMVTDNIKFTEEGKDFTSPYDCTGSFRKESLSYRSGIGQDSNIQS